MIGYDRVPFSPVRAAQLCGANDTEELSCHTACTSSLALHTCTAQTEEGD